MSGLDDLIGGLTKSGGGGAGIEDLLGGLLGGGGSSGGLDDLVLVEVDLDGAEHARDERAHQPRLIRSATVSEARRAAATGSRPRARPSR